MVSFVSMFSYAPQVLPDSSTLVLLRTQYPASTIRETLLVEVEPCIYLHVEMSGNPRGIPVVFVHGGPGCRFERADHQWFDPDKYFIIVFQQRGTGDSYPTMELSADSFKETNLDNLKETTLDTLVDDLDTLRKQLGITRWAVFGGSWGSTLSLAYAQKYSRFCLGLTLRGIYLATKAENHVFFSGLKAEDEVVKKFLDYPKKFGLNLRLEDPDTIYEAYKILIVDKRDLTAAKLWAKFEGYVDNPCDISNVEQILDDSALPNPEEVSTSFWQTLLFPQIARTTNLLDKERLLNLKGMKIRIIQGASDNLCNDGVADTLVKELLKEGVDVDYKKVSNGAHSAYDPLIMHELLQATDAFAQELSKFSDGIVI